MFEVQTKTLGPLRYVSRTAQVHVAELSSHIVETVRELKELHEATGPDFVVYHGEVNEQDDGPVEVALPTESGEHQLAETEVAFTVAEGADTEFPAILGAYDAVAGWAKRNGRELAGPPLEINHDDGGVCRIEIAWPIRWGAARQGVSSALCPSTSASATFRASGTSSSATTAPCSPKR